MFLVALCGRLKLFPSQIIVNLILIMTLRIFDGRKNFFDLLDFIQLSFSFPCWTDLHFIYIESGCCVWYNNCSSYSSTVTTGIADFKDVGGPFLLALSKSRFSWIC